MFIITSGKDLKVTQQIDSLVFVGDKLVDEIDAPTDADIFHVYYSTALSIRGRYAKGERYEESDPELSAKLKAEAKILARRNHIQDADVKRLCGIRNDYVPEGPIPPGVDQEALTREVEETLGGGEGEDSGGSGAGERVPTLRVSP